MGLKSFRPITPTQRFRMAATFEEVTRDKPERSLTTAQKKSGGRNVHGRITCRHRGGGHKQRYRIIDFKRNRRDVAAVVESVEYDPNRTCRIALIKYQDGELRYIIAPDGLKVGQTVVAGENVEPQVGNAVPLRKVPVGTPVHCVELTIGRGAQLGRSAGAQIFVTSRDKGYCTLKMPSGEVRLVNENCFATIGQVGNSEHMNIKLGKAGRKRWMGWRPTVRGMVMNPIDHPNGGGQGKSKGGGGWQHLVSPWGQVAKGKKTRARYKPTNKFILQRRQTKRQQQASAQAK
ncbi:MAG: 50S ribosomal protein L2 [Verrucomicrobiae bacterium]|nr:50S ribosomal protein L2 [Verrucomicrobiae bacterium]